MNERLGRWPVGVCDPDWMRVRGQLEGRLANEGNKGLRCSGGPDARDKRVGRPVDGAGLEIYKSAAGTGETKCVDCECECHDPAADKQQGMFVFFFLLSLSWQFVFSLVLSSMQHSK